MRRVLPFGAATAAIALAFAACSSGSEGDGGATVPSFPPGTEGEALVNIMGAYCDRLATCDPGGFSLGFQSENDCVVKAIRVATPAEQNGPSKCTQDKVDQCASDNEKVDCAIIETSPDGGPGARLAPSCDGC
jgi:hypothetical protein